MRVNETPAGPSSLAVDTNVLDVGVWVDVEAELHIWLKRDHALIAPSHAFRLVYLRSPFAPATSVWLNARHSDLTSPKGDVTCPL
jgi:hypothetical protein